MSGRTPCLVLAVLSLALLSGRSPQSAVRDTRDFLSAPPQAYRLAGSRELVSTAWDPSYSPDGGKVVFVKLDTDRITASDPAPLPRDLFDQVLTAGPGDLDSQIWAMDADGSGQVQLTHGPGWRAYPTFSPDGKDVSFVRRLFSDAEERYSEELWVLSVGEDTSRRVLADDVTVGGGTASLYMPGFGRARPIWIPAGDGVIFVGKDGGFYIWRVREGVVEPFCGKPLLSDPPGGSQQDPALLLPRYPTWGRGLDGSDHFFFIWGDYLWRVAGERERPERIVPATEFSVSLDGKTLALTRGTEGTTTIEILDVETCSNRLTLSLVGGYSRRGESPPVWSPDGSKLLHGNTLVDVEHGTTAILAGFGRHRYGGRMILLKGVWRPGHNEILFNEEPPEGPRPVPPGWRGTIVRRSFHVNPFLAAREAAEIHVPTAVEMIANAIDWRRGGDLRSPTDGVSAPTRLVCSAVSDRLFDRMLMMIYEKHVDKLGAVQEFGNSRSYMADPLADGPGEGFLRYLSPLPIAGEFRELSQDAASAYLRTSHTHKVVSGYPLLASLPDHEQPARYRIFYSSLCQGVNLDVRIEEPNELGQDSLDVLTQALEPFFALEFLHDADAAYGVPLEDSLSRIQSKLRTVAGERAARRAARADQLFSDSGWPKFQRDIRNTGYVDEKLQLPLELKWTVTLDGVAGGVQPVADEDYLYVYLSESEKSDVNLVQILDRRNGAEVTRVMAPLRSRMVRQTPVIARDTLYFFNQEHVVMAINKGSWEQKWACPLSRAYTDVPMTLAHGLLLFQNQSGYLYAIDPETGLYEWKEAVENATTVPVVVGRRIIHTSGDLLIARDIDDGRLLWKQALNQNRNLPRERHWYFGGGLCAQDDRVFAVCARSPSRDSRKTKWYVKSFSVDDGTPLWQHNVVLPLGSLRLACNSEMVFATCPLAAIDSKTGTRRWNADLGEPYGYQPIVVGEHVVLASLSQLHIVESATGTVVQTIDIPSGKGGSSIYCNGYVYVVDVDGHVYAFGPSPETLPSR